MKVYTSIEDINLSDAIVTIGMFDGVHLAHHKIIKQLRELADNKCCRTVLITFWPHPRIVLNKNAGELKLLSTLEEKKILLEKAGLDNLIVLSFTKEFAELSYHDFIKNILIDRLQTKHLVIGHNHQFGKNRQGNFEKLKEYSEKYGFNLQQLSAQSVQNEEISSTVIRKSLEAGEIKKARLYLGYDYFLSGRVIKGNSIGKTLGFPTANLDVPEKWKLIPANGVYAVETMYKNTSYKGMMNIGFRPTLDDKNKSHNLEVNIFNFNKEIYGETLTIYFKEYIRAEQKFGSREKLIRQIEHDKKKISALFNL